MTRKAHPSKGVPREVWLAQCRAAKAEKSAAGNTPVEQAKAAFNPNVVRETLQPPQAKVPSFPDNKVEVDAPQYDFSPENIPPNLFSGDQKHLEVMGLNGSTTDPIPGFKLYWFDAKNGVRIQMAQRSGYTFVEKNEVLLNDAIEGSDDLGTRVRKIGNIFGGATDDGKPQYMYLMKKPMWLVDTHNLQMEAVNKKYEEMVRTGNISRNPARDRQFAGGSPLAVQQRSNLPPIEIADGLYRERR